MEWKPAKGRGCKVYEIELCIMISKDSRGNYTYLLYNGMGYGRAGTDSRSGFCMGRHFIANDYLNGNILYGTQ